MNHRILRGSLLSTCIALSACGGGGGTGGGGTTPPLPGAPPVITFNHIFPQGDATAASGVAWDIVGVRTTLSGPAGDSAGQLYDTLRVDVTFAQDVSTALPAPGTLLDSGMKLGVGLSFNTDNSIATGAYETCDVASHVKPFEYISDPGEETGRLVDGNYAIIGPSGPIFSGAPNPPEEAVTNVSGHAFTQTFYLPALGVASGQEVPRIGIDVAAINRPAGVTDCVPSGNSEIYTDHQ